MKEGSTTVATFEYDGEGRRTDKVAAGLTHQYIYDAEDIVEERISGSSSDTIRYYHGAGIDEPLARKNSADVVTYYLADHLGSIVQESSAAGAITLEREYDPWGVATQGASTSGYAFTGREWDAETGLYSYRSRYYSPDLARWLSEDSIGLAGGINLSAYVAANPTRLVDPFGWCGAENDRTASTGPPPVPVPGAPDPPYLDRYLQHLDKYLVNVGPYAAGLLGGLWPKSLAPATGGRPPALGSDNPLTSLPRALGLPGAAMASVRTGAAATGVATVGVGMYNVGVFVSGLVYAAFPGSNGIPTGNK